jgi:hypothetical protein
MHGACAAAAAVGAADVHSCQVLHFPGGRGRPRRLRMEVGMLSVKGSSVDARMAIQPSGP